MSITTKYKIRDTATGKFWMGETRYLSFNSKGKEWPSSEKAQEQLVRMASYGTRWNNVNLEKVYKYWEIVEVQYTAAETKKEDVKAVLREHEVRRIAMESLEKNKQVNSWYVSQFFTNMTRKKVMDQIEFILFIKPAEGSNHVDMERVIEARAQLRQLGVKTRTFREHSGMFGMMDRDQAMKARLVLDLTAVVDLGACRAEAAKKFP